jgi:pimeloyl-ACP methyl ester carboxylesterase
LLVAHILGGRVAITATRRKDNRVAEVILFDTLFPEPDHFGGPATWKATRRTYDSREAALDRFRLIPAQPVDEGSLRELAEHSVRRVSDGWTWKHDYRLNPAGIEVVPLCPVAVPVTIAYGELSSIVDEQAANRAATLAGNLATVMMVPETHHHLVLEAPAVVADVILNHLSYPTKEH